MKALGGSEGVDKTPGLLVEPHALEHGLSFLLLCAHSFWDCWVLNDGQDRWLLVSHDEFFQLGAFHSAEPNPEWIRAVPEWVGSN